jgi:hypothetical protein
LHEPSEITDEEDLAHITRWTPTLRMESLRAPTFFAAFGAEKFLACLRRSAFIEVPLVTAVTLKRAFAIAKELDGPVYTP